MILERYHPESELAKVELTRRLEDDELRRVAVRAANERDAADALDPHPRLSRRQHRQGGLKPTDLQELPPRREAVRRSEPPRKPPAPEPPSGLPLPRVAQGDALPGGRGRDEALPLALDREQDARRGAGACTRRCTGPGPPTLHLLPRSRGCATPCPPGKRCSLTREKIWRSLLAK